MTVRILIGDVFAQLALMPDCSVDCVVTSPPYWGLRDYGVEGQIGLEPTLGEHLDVMVRVFEEIRRVLKPTGTLWLNYGDCYATSPNGRSAADTKATGNDDRTFRDKPFSTIGPIYNPNASQVPDNKNPKAQPQKGRIQAGGMLKAKDLCMVPNRLAIALQQAGWWVRSEIIWAKPNPMPESINDRPATAHEKIFLLSKSARYHYDAGAVRQGMAESSCARLAQDVEAQVGSDRANGGTKTNGRMKAVGGARRQDAEGRLPPVVSDDRKALRGPTESRHRSSIPGGQSLMALPDGGRNLRNYDPPPMQVWKIATAAFSEAHFATFPPELAQRCLLAGCPKGGKVLDPFGGAGTVGLVASTMGLDCDLIELNPEYAEIARSRLRAGLARVEMDAPETNEFGPLFAGQPS